MSYYKSKSKSRWSDPSAHAKSGIACLGSSESYSIHKHLHLSHIAVLKENSKGETINLEDEKTISGKEIQEPSCTIQEQGHNIVFHHEASQETDRVDDERESLKHEVFSLLEDKTELEIQLLFYHGLREQQQSTVKDLQMKVEEKTSQIELLGKRIESLIRSGSLQIENLASEREKLKAQVEQARTKLKETKIQMQKSWRKKKDAMIKLWQQVASQRSRVMEMSKREGDMNKIIEGLHGEIRQLKETNLGLMNEKSELMTKMDSITECVTVEKEATEKALEDANRLKVANAELSNQLEMYQKDSETDIQELLYLRWINTCLRHELQKRNRRGHEKDEKEKKTPQDLCSPQSKSHSDDTDSSCVTEEESVDSSGVLGTTKRTRPAKPKFIYKIWKWVDPYEIMREEEGGISKSASMNGRSTNTKSSSNAHAKRIISFCGKMDYVNDAMVVPRSRSMLVKATLMRERPTIQSR